MWITAFGILIVVAVALFVSWPLLLGSDAGRAHVGMNQEASRVDQRRSQWQREKRVALAAIKEAEFDHRVGKLSEGDYAMTRAELEGRALEALVALEAEAADGKESAARPKRGPSPSDEPKTSARAGAIRPAKFCGGCGKKVEKGARFCATCGRPSSGTTVRNEDA